MNIATQHASDQKRLSEITHRIGKALGKELGGRFNVLGNVGKEEGEGMVSRTLKIVDRWGTNEEDLSCTIELRKD
jgi:diadenosine tetraphosphate (Ap4A) HIT family hydrolase